MNNEELKKFIETCDLHDKKNLEIFTKEILNSLDGVIKNIDSFSINELKYILSFSRDALKTISSKI